MSIKGGCILVQHLKRQEKAKRTKLKIKKKGIESETREGSEQSRANVLLEDQKRRSE